MESIFTPQGGQKVYLETQRGVGGWGEDGKKHEIGWLSGTTCGGSHAFESARERGKKVGESVIVVFLFFFKHTFLI
jgi:hypothetical protein